MAFFYLYVIGGTALLIFILASLYRIVPADFADVVIQSGRARVYSSHKQYSPDGKSAYFQIPSWFFFFKLGMQVHRIPLKIIPVNVPNFLAFDKDRARFVCDIVTYVIVKDPIEAAKRFAGDLEVLNTQISVIVQSTTRDVTTKKAIREVINNRQDVIEAVTPILSETIDNWGLELKSLELIDFKDPDPSFGVESKVIHDISSIIEKQINSEARQKNAEQLKIARTKEAEADEEAKKREIMRDEEVAKREQEKNMKVAEKQKEAREKELDVIKVQQVKSQEIEKERAIVEANQKKEIETINKEQKRLEGEGDRARAEEQAKGDAAPIREKGYAEADAKEKLQEALNKFEDKAIRALVAEKIVEMQQAIGVASAKALEQAEMKVFVGSDSGGGFDTGKVIESIRVSSEASAKSVLNRLARPLDLGIIGLESQRQEKPKEAKK